jgi:hypothetical protein
MFCAGRGILRPDSARPQAVACLVSYRREVGQMSPSKSGKKAKPKKAKPGKKK